jgi:hypothetical protein
MESKTTISKLKLALDENNVMGQIWKLLQDIRYEDMAYGKLHSQSKMLQ